MGKNNKKSTEFERFYKSIEIKNDCWQWQGYIMNAGYGAFATSSGTQLVHRWSYKQFVGEIPIKMTIDHLCKNKLCANPRHLEVVTRKENINRAGLTGVALKESLKTHCKNGHEYNKYGIKYRNGYTKFGTLKYARRCTKCDPKYLRYYEPI